MVLEYKLARLATLSSLVLSAILLAAAASLWVAHRQEPDTAQASTRVEVRIGTFDRTKLLVAYYGSEFHSDFLGELRERRDAAEAVGDHVLSAELEAEGALSQDLAHRQLMGVATLDNVLAPFSGDWPEIAQQAQVDVIVERPLYLGPGVDRVDVTQLLVDRLASPVGDAADPGASPAAGG